MEIVEAVQAMNTELLHNFWNVGKYAVVALLAAPMARELLGAVLFRRR